MDCAGSLSPVSSPLSSPAKTPYPSLHKTSDSSPTSNSAQRHSPERECACPCGPFQSQLEAAITLMSFKLHPVPMLHTVPYPSDTITEKHIPVAELRKYSRTHVWPDGMHCFCSLRANGEARSVRFVIPSQGILQGSPCLSCPDWTPDGTGGCRYFVNLSELFKDSESLFRTDVVPLYNFPRRGNNPNRKRARTMLTSNGAHPSAPAASLSSEPAPSAFKPSAPNVQDYIPLTFGVKPGSISDPARIWSPPPPHDLFMRVEDMPFPADSEVQEVFDEMLNGIGVSCRRFMAVIGGCIACDQVMALPNIPTHPCIGRTTESGPHPSKYPRLLEDRRVLPTAGSRIKADAMQATIKADEQGDNDSDVEVDGKVNYSPTLKRKLRFNLLPQRVFIGERKRRRITNNGGPSQIMPVSTQPAEIVDLTLSSPIRNSTPVSTQPAGTIDLTPPVRIPTPDGSREVHRDANEEFIMYEKA